MALLRLLAISLAVSSNLVVAIMPYHEPLPTSDGTITALGPLGTGAPRPSGSGLPSGRSNGTRPDFTGRPGRPMTMATGLPMPTENLSTEVPTEIPGIKRALAANDDGPIGLPAAASGPFNGTALPSGGPKPSGSGRPKGSRAPKASGRPIHTGTPTGPGPTDLPIDLPTDEPAPLSKRGPDGSAPAGTPKPFASGKPSASGKPEGPTGEEKGSMTAAPSDLIGMPMPTGALPSGFRPAGAPSGFLTALRPSASGSGKKGAAPGAKATPAPRS